MTGKSAKWLADHPEVAALRLAAVDLNGVARGKRMPAALADKALKGGLRMPLSTLNVDIWGEDIAQSPLVFASGDADGALSVTERGIVPMGWFDTKSALLPLWMSNDDGTPFAGDPRRALARILKRFAERGLTPVVATEMEFYLLDGRSETPAPPVSPQSGRTMAGHDVLSLAGIDAFDTFFSELYATCAAMDIPADALISESGPGQFEINLLHRADALGAADDAWLFKMAAKGVARKHGMCASFMAKPYTTEPGNGMHVHFSLVDDAGRNVFDDGSAEGSEMLGHVLAGLLDGMRASTLLFAPHFNSYRRMAPGNHAPTSLTWGYENRTTAIRIPGGAAQARRIEHRVAGGDANPYLMLTAILGAALVGIENGLEPPAPIRGNAYDAQAPRLPDSWKSAIDLFEADPMIARIFTSDLIRNLVLCKRQELQTFAGKDDAFEFLTYAEAV